MSIAQPFYTMVPESGMITLPPEFRGKTVKLLTEEEEEKLARIKQADYNFRHPKTLEEILKDAKPIRDIKDLHPEEPIWDSDEEFFEFLDALGEDVENYRSIERLSKRSLT